MRTTMKTTTFAITHFTVAFSVAWALTGSFVIGGLIALVEPAINTVAYAIHERIWEKIPNTQQQTSKREAMTC